MCYLFIVITMPSLLTSVLLSVIAMLLGVIIYRWYSSSSETQLSIVSQEYTKLRDELSKALIDVNLKIEAARKEDAGHLIAILEKTRDSIEKDMASNLEITTSKIRSLLDTVSSELELKLKTLEDSVSTHESVVSKKYSDLNTTVELMLNGIASMKADSDRLTALETSLSDLLTSKLPEDRKSVFEKLASVESEWRSLLNGEIVKLDTESKKQLQAVETLISANALDIVSIKARLDSMSGLDPDLITRLTALDAKITGAMNAYLPGGDPKTVVLKGQLDDFARQYMLIINSIFPQINELNSKLQSMSEEWRRLENVIEQSKAESKLYVDNLGAGLNAKLAEVRTLLESVSDVSDVNSQDTRKLQDKINEYISFNDAKLSNIIARIDSRTLQDHNALQDIRNQINTIDIKMGTMPIKSGESIVEVLDNIRKQLSEYAGANPTMLEFKDKIGNILGLIGDASDMKDIQSGFYNYHKVLSMLEEVDSILHRVLPPSEPAASVFSSADYVKWVGYKKAIYSGGNGGKMDQLYLVDDMISSMNKFVSTFMDSLPRHIGVSEEDRSAIRNLIAKSRIEASDSRNKNGILSYLRNIQYTADKLWTRAGSQQDLLDGLSNNITILKELLGDSSMLRSDNLIEAVNQMQGVVDSLSSKSSIVENDLTTLKAFMRDQVNKSVEVVRYNQIVDGVLEDLIRMSRVVGPGGFRGDSLSAAMAKAQEDISNQQSALHWANEETKKLKALIIDPSESNDLGGSIINNLSALKKQMLTLALSIGDYRPGDFNSMRLVDLLKSMNSEIVNMGVAIANNRTMSASASSLVSDFTRLKELVGASQPNGDLWYGSNIVDKIKLMEKTISNLISDRDSILEYNRSNTANIKSLTTNQTALSNTLASLQKTIGDLNIPNSLSAMNSRLNASLTSINDLHVFTSELKSAINKLASDNINSGSSMSSLVESINAARSDVESIRETSKVNTSDLQKLSEEVKYISQGAFIGKVKSSLAAFVSGYNKMRPSVVRNEYDRMFTNLITNVGSGIHDTLAAAEKIASYKPVDQWRLNRELYELLIKCRTGMTSMYAVFEPAMRDKSLSDTKYAALVWGLPGYNSAWSTSISFAIDLYKNLYEPMTTFLETVNSWLDDVPIWVKVNENSEAIASIGLRTKTNEDSIIELKKLQTSVGDWDMVVLGDSMASAMVKLMSTTKVTQDRMDGLDTLIGNVESFRALLANDKSNSLYDVVTKLVDGLDSLKNKHSISSNELDMITKKVSSLASVVGSYNGNLLEDINRLNSGIIKLQETSNNAATVLASAASMDARLVLAEADLSRLNKYMSNGVVVSLVNNISQMQAFDFQGDTFYAHTPGQFRSRATTLVNAARSINLDSLRDWHVNKIDVQLFSRLKILYDTCVDIDNPNTTKMADAFSGFAAMSIHQPQNVYRSLLATLENFLQTKSPTGKALHLAMVEMTASIASIGKAIDESSERAARMEDYTAARLHKLKTYSDDMLQSVNMVSNEGIRTYLTTNLQTMSAAIQKWRPGLLDPALFELVRQMIFYVDRANSQSSRPRSTQEWLNTANELLEQSSIYNTISKIESGFTRMDSAFSSVTNGLASLNSITASITDLSSRMSTISAAMDSMRAASASSTLTIPETSLSSLTTPTLQDFVLIIENGNITNNGVYPTGHLPLRLTNMPASNSNMHMLPAYIRNATCIQIGMVIRDVNLYNPSIESLWNGSSGGLLYQLATNSSTAMYGPIHTGLTNPAGTTLVTSTGMLNFGTFDANGKRIIRPATGPAISSDMIPVIIDAARFSSLRSRPTSRIMLEFSFRNQSFPTVPSVVIPETKMMQFSRDVSIVRREPSVDAGVHVNFDKGFSLQRRVSSIVNSTSDTQNNWLCPSGHYMCGISRPSLNPVCCSFALN